MKASCIQHLFLVLCMLSLTIITKAQTSININGPDEVCTGSQHVYSVNPTTGVSYTWTVTSKGSITLLTSNSVTISWGIDGSATVTVQGYNSIGTQVETGTWPVTIHPLPEPQIVSNFPIACRPLKHYPLDQMPDFDSSECLTSCIDGGSFYVAVAAWGSSYTWTAGGGTVTPANSGNVVWNGPGLGSVTVTETTSAGCSGSNTVCVDIIESPKAHFVALPDTSLRQITACEGAPVLFLDKSVNMGGSPIVSWFWDFDDGTYSNAPGGTLTPLTHTFATAGSYTVQLVVTNACGCTSWETIEVEVQQDAGVTISCPGVVCENDTAFYSVDVPCSASSWSVTGGTVWGMPTASTIAVIWNNVGSDGFGYVMYDPSACPGVCPATTVAKVPVVTQAQPIEGDIVICPDGAYLYKLPQWPSTKFTWSVSPTSVGATLHGTGQPNEIVIKTPANSGTITLQCDYENTLLGCLGTSTLVIDILDPEEILGDKKVCLNTLGDAYTLNGGNSGTWTLTFPNLGNTSSSGSSFPAGHLFDQVGVYRLEVAGTGFCPPKPFLITVDPLPPTPTSIDGPDTLCKGVPVQFTGNAVLSSSVLRWQMQNGTISPEQGDFTYAKMNTTSNGPFIISLWREGKEAPFCHSDTITKTLDTPFIQVVVAGDTTPCVDTYVPYTVDYIDGESYTWTIAPEVMGSVESGQNSPNITVLWNHKPDTAWVICEIRKCYGVFRDSLRVVVSPNIQVITNNGGWTNMGACPGEGISIDLQANVATSTWDFGDGTPPVTFSGGVGHHTYDNVYGPPQYAPFNNYVWYTVTWTATNPSGCPNNLGPVTTQFPMSMAPWTNIIPASVLCEPTLPFPNSHLLTAKFNPVNPKPQWYKWYRNGTLLHEGPVDSTHSANNYGEYYVIAYDAIVIGPPTGPAGCSDTSTNRVIIKDCTQSGCALNPLPFLAIDSARLDSCGYVKLWASHTTPNWVSSSWSVTNPDNVKTSVTSATAAEFWFKKAGIYTFTYQGAFSDGQTLCVIDDQVQVIVPYTPDIDLFAYCDVLNGDRKVQFSHKNTSFAIPAQWQYAVNSGNFQAANTLWWLSPGVYNVGMQITATGYPTCTYYESVTVPDLPQADFATTRYITCEKEAPAVFNNLSTNASTAFWDFADGAQNTQYHPERVFEDDGSYNVFLEVTDIYGCTDDTTKTVTIANDEIEGITTHSPANPCEGTAVTLTYTPKPGTPNYGDIYKWKTNNTIFAIGTSFNATVYKSGYYWVYTEDQYGCWDEAEADTVNVTHVPKISVFGRHDACVGAEFTLSGYAGSMSGLTYQWYRDNVPVGTQSTLTETINTAGTYDYKVELTMLKPGGGSCSRMSPVFTVEVRDNPVSPVPFFNVARCSPYLLELDVSPQPAGTYRWSNGTIGLPALMTEGGAYQLIYTDQYGCKADTSLMTPKHPDAYIWIFPSGCYSLCNGATYKLAGPIIPFSWAYLQNGGTWQSGTGIVPQVTINATGVYRLDLSDGYCTARSEPMDVNLYGCAPKTGNNISDVAVLKAALDIVPNPAQNSTRIDFALPGNKEQYTIEIYDALGRKLATMQPPVSKGSWHLQLDGYTPGAYQVILRAGDQVLLQKRLSVVK